MTEHQFLSLWQWDHNILHTDGGSDAYWNLTPMFRAEHKQKTERDLRGLYKSKRIRAVSPQLAFLIGAEQGMIRGISQERERQKGRKIASRGFNKTLTRGFDGKVRARRERRKQVT